MIEEEFCKQTEVLTVYFVLLSINLVHCQSFVSVYFNTGRHFLVTLSFVVDIRPGELHVSGIDGL